jgi:AcrR family transcriptional regulator
MTGQERRQQLLDIGRRLFAERGFEGTSIEEIAAQAGVSKPVVYEHFGGKEGLYAVVVDREVERLTTVTTVTLSEGPYSKPKFEEAAVSLLRTSTTTPTASGSWSGTPAQDPAAAPTARCWPTSRARWSTSWPTS